MNDFGELCKLLSDTNNGFTLIFKQALPLGGVMN
jgi:hypothetical protein